MAAQADKLTEPEVPATAPASTPSTAVSAQKVLQKAIKDARDEYSTTTNAAKVTRDKKIADAYAAFTVATTPATTATNGG